MYWELGGPKDEELFDPEKLYSPYCHTFIMVHPDVLVCTRDDVGEGFLVYLGPKQMYSLDEEHCPYPLSEIDDNLRVPETTNVLPSEGNIRIYAPDPLNLAEANKQLLFGFYDAFEGYEHYDSRLLPGEFVIVEHLDDYGNITQMFRIESLSYNWRSGMRNNNPNVHHRFYELIDSSYLKNRPEDKDRYCRLFPLLTKYNCDNLKETIEKHGITVWYQKFDEELEFPRSRDMKLYNIWQCYLVSVPLHKQKEASEYYENLLKKREELIAWIYWLSCKKVDPTQFSKRMVDILLKTRKFAQDKIKRKENVDTRTGKVKNVDELTRDNIRNFIHKELGASLYRLIREMDKWKAEQKEKDNEGDEKQ